jgi:hypothetical protein
MHRVSIFCLLLCSSIFLAGIAVAQDTNFSIGPQYLMTSGSPLLARPIATPSLSLSEAAPASAVSAEMNSATQTPTVLDQSQADLTRVYWGSREVSEVPGESSSTIEIVATGPSPTLPASIIEVGVEQTTDAQSLRGRGIGVTLAEAASLWKTHKTHAPRVFTNRDIERLHGG